MVLVDAAGGWREMKGAGPAAAAEVRGGFSLEAISRELM